MGRNTHNSTACQTALIIKASRALYGDALTEAACIEELQNCITKGVWECLDPDHNPRGAIPSKMFLTPKNLPTGNFVVVEEGSVLSMASGYNPALNPINISIRKLLRCEKHF